MTSTPPDDSLNRALGDLPRERASGAFTQKVLANHERRRPTGWRGLTKLRWALVAASAALVLLVGGLALKESRQERSERALVQRAEQLRTEYRLLQKELATVRRVMDEHSPRIYLGGNERVDLVFDLAPVAARPAASRVRPAVLEENRLGQELRP